MNVVYEQLANVDVIGLQAVVRELSKAGRVRTFRIAIRRPMGLSAAVAAARSKLGLGESRTGRGAGHHLRCHCLQSAENSPQ